MTRTLSNQLDEARTMEEHYRALLLFWKKRRQRLEVQIPDSTNNLFNQIRQLLGDSDGNSN